MNFVEELKWRGMVHDIMPGTEEQLNKEMTTAYVGIDPTADSLHIGHLVSIMILKHFQRCGHKPIFLVGGATGMIGDPSGKSLERNLLDEETLRRNQEGIRRQLSHLIDFESDAPNAAELVNNYDWMKNFTFLEFIRDIGKCITVNYMMAKDSVKKRFSGEGDGMSFTEFTYQLVQGTDFLHLYQHKNCKLQMGGSDQWGNITTGTELIRRKTGGEAFGLTCPLIKKADGTKFGKTEAGNVWLDARYTSPYQFYQFWLNVSDEDAERYIKIFTMLDRQTIDALIVAHREAPFARVAENAGPRDYLHDSFRGGVSQGGRGFGYPIRKCDGRCVAPDRRADVPTGFRRSSAVRSAGFDACRRSEFHRSVHRTCVGFPVERRSPQADPGRRHIAQQREGYRGRCDRFGLRPDLR